MGEHTTWLDYLKNYEGWRGGIESVQSWLGRDWQWLMFKESGFSLGHVFFAFLIGLFVIYGGFRFHRAMKEGGTASLIPPATLNIRNLFEIICDAILSTMEGVMGEKNARKFFPFIASLAFFILFCNLMAIVPGMGVPTATLNTNVALAMLVFFATHIYGIKEHGAAYLKHFTGPILVLAPLFIIIELIGHLARPVSLSLRLLGNMVGDHKVVFSFFTLVPLVVPVPFLLLGILVCVIQATVFCLLSVVYLQMAIAHDH